MMHPTRLDLRPTSLTGGPAWWLMRPRELRTRNGLARVPTLTNRAAPVRALKHRTASAPSAAALARGQA